MRAMTEDFLYNPPVPKPRGVVRHEWHNGGHITRGAWWKNRRPQRRPSWLKNLGRR